MRVHTENLKSMSLKNLKKNNLTSYNSYDSKGIFSYKYYVKLVSELRICE